MKKSIATVKLLLITIHTLSVYLIYFLGLMAVSVLRLNFESWRNLAMKTWAKGVALILRMNIHITGTPPAPPFFLVSNHLSYIDIVVLNSVLKTTFIAKSEVKKWPVIGFMAKTMGVIFIDRARIRDVTRVNKVVSEQLNERQGVILFPEGKTSSGVSVLPFRSPLLKHPATENIDVSYAALSYSTGSSDEPAYKSVNWWEDTPFYKHIFKMAMNKRITANIYFGKNTVRNPDRKLLANKLHEEVSKIFKPMVSEKEINHESNNRSKQGIE
ncbi:MAG: lysophospholipid acyltransferase family protein [Balneolaceae bacterium]